MGVITTKKPTLKKRPARKRGERSKRPLGRKRDRAKDEAERVKIGKTLDIEAFMKAHKDNASAIAKYWEEAE